MDGWTADRVELTKAMWISQNYSAAQIALRIGGGLTRNAVIGKMHRMGLARSPGVINHLRARARKKTVHQIHGTRLSAERKKQLVRKGYDPKRPKNAPRDWRLMDLQLADNALERANTRAAGAPVGGVQLLELTGDMCRWPLNDPKEPDFHFCGAPRDPVSSYCEGHAQLSRSRSMDGISEAEAVTKAA